MFSALLFVFLFCILFYWINNVVRYKVKEVDAISIFYDQPKDSVDVLIMGSSHAFLSMSPMELWNREGISSFNLGTPSQTLALTYYLLKDAIRTQHPEVVVLEVYGGAYESQLPNLTRIHMVTDCMPVNKNKLNLYKELLKENLTEDEQFEIWFPFFRYHSRWEELTAEDFFFRKGYLRGYKDNYQYRQLEEPKIRNKLTDISDEAMEYFEKIVQLCDAEEIELVACRIPMADHNAYARRTRKMNTILTRAEELGLKILDYEKLREEVPLDYSCDFLDSQHTNASGAIKISKYLAEYLKENFDLADHREDPEYLQWEKDAVIYQDAVRTGMENMTELIDVEEDEEEDEQ